MADPLTKEEREDVEYARALTTYRPYVHVIDRLVARIESLERELYGKQESVVDATDCPLAQELAQAAIEAESHGWDEPANYLREAANAVSFAITNLSTASNALVGQNVRPSHLKWGKDAAARIGNLSTALIEKVEERGRNAIAKLCFDEIERLRVNNPSFNFGPSPATSPRLIALNDALTAMKEA